VAKMSARMRAWSGVSGVSQPLTSPIAAALSMPCGWPPGPDQQVKHVGHPEHGGMHQRGPARDAAGIWPGARVDIGARVDEHARHLKVAVAGGCHQRRLGVVGQTIDRSACVDQGLGDLAGPGKLAGQAESLVVKADHCDICQWVGGLVIRPVDHPLNRQAWIVGEKRRHTGEVTAIENVAALHFGLEPGPAAESVFAGERQLRGRQDLSFRHCPDSRDGLAVAGRQGMTTPSQTRGPRRAEEIAS
jgi:hypothetical protein